MNKAAAIVTLCALLLAACGPSAEELAEEGRAIAEPKLAQVNKVGKTAITYTEAAVDIKLPDGIKLNFDETGNAIMVQSEFFAEGDARKPRLDMILDDSCLEAAHEILTKGPEGGHPNYVSGTFDQLDALKYLVVVRTTLYSDPVVMDDANFSFGMWQGDVMVFNVEDAKCIGRVEISARNSDEVDVKTDDPGKWLHSDLWSRVRGAINEALKAHTEGEVLN